jgi:hypothetical protein
MADQRTVTIHLNSVQQTQIVETLNTIHTAKLFELLDAVKADSEDYEARSSYKAAHRIIPRHEFYAAIGYLSSWNMTFPTVDIYPHGHSDTNTDLLAVYRKEDGSTGYSLAAIWQETHYSFHS